MMLAEQLIDQILEAKDFILDAGHKLVATTPDGKKINIGRYGVWKYDKSKGKPQVVDTGDDMNSLKKKHGDLPVVKMK